MQAGLVFVGLQVIFYQLYEIRRSLNKKTSIVMGIASIKDYPISKIKGSELLKQVIEVSNGYAHFLLAIRNDGKSVVKNVKIFLEFAETSPSGKEIGLLFAVMKVSEFSKDKKGFVPENNVEFTFIGGSDYSIFPGDTDTFGFYFQTAVRRKMDSGDLVPESPAPCICFLRGTLWAEDLEKPITKVLEVRIK